MSGRVAARIGRAPGVLRAVWRWLTDDRLSTAAVGDGDRIDWVRCAPFVFLHLAVLAVIWVGFSWVALGVACVMYAVRMFFVTGFYHRYFSHRAFRASRWFAFAMGVAACTAGQRGPLWWAAHHRRHHNHSDEPGDEHSPRQVGFWMSHVGWFMKRGAFATDGRLVRDWMRYPELRWLNRFDWVPLIATAAAMYALGAVLGRWWPGLGTSGPQMLVWGFVISTIVLYHGTYTVNSLAHVFGRRRFETGDDSRNSLAIALVTLGEGWHNNHHHYPASARQGFYWWEIDVTYYGLRVLEWVGLIRDLRPVPRRVLDRGRRVGAGRAGSRLAAGGAPVSGVAKGAA